MTNNKDNLTKYPQDLERYETIMRYFIRNSDRKITQNVGYLQDVKESLKNIYSSINDNTITDVDALRSVLIKERSKYLCDKLEGILNKDLKIKLDDIEASREKETLIDQWIGELI